MPRNLLRAIACVTLAPALVLGQQREEVFAGNAVPWGISRDVWTRAIEAANATGIYSVPGVAVASAGSKPISQSWTLRIDVAGPIPLSTASQPGISDADKARFFTATRFILDPPVRTELDPGVTTQPLLAWQLGIVTLTDGGGLTNRVQFDDISSNGGGSCVPALSETCRKYIESLYVGASRNARGLSANGVDGSWDSSLPCGGINNVFSQKAPSTIIREYPRDSLMSSRVGPAKSSHTQPWRPRFS